jgi:hypothetical protein
MENNNPSNQSDAARGVAVRTSPDTETESSDVSQRAADPFDPATQREAEGADLEAA